MKKTIIIFIVLAALLALVIFVKQKHDQQKNIKSANMFWTDFRKAVLANDKKALSSMTSFPFPIIIGRGDFMDGKYSKDALSLVFHRKENFHSLFDVLINLNDQEMYNIIKQTDKS